MPLMRRDGGGIVTGLWHFDVDVSGRILRDVLIHGSGGPLSSQWTEGSVRARLRRLARLGSEVAIWTRWDAGGGESVSVPAATVRVVEMRLEAVS